MRAEQGSRAGRAGKGIFRAPEGPVQLGPVQTQRSSEG